MRVPGAVPRGSPGPRPPARSGGPPAGHRRPEDRGHQPHTCDGVAVLFVCKNSLEGSIENTDLITEIPRHRKPGSVTRGCQPCLQPWEAADESLLTCEPFLLEWVEILDFFFFFGSSTFPGLFVCFTTLLVPADITWRAENRAGWMPPVGARGSGGERGSPGLSRPAGAAPRRAKG